MHTKPVSFIALYIMLGGIFITQRTQALMWNDPNITPVQTISDHRWRDANTGRLINTTGMPDTGINPNNPAQNPPVNPAPPVQPTNPGNTGGGSTPPTNPGNTGGGNTGGGNTGGGNTGGGNTGNRASFKSTAGKVARGAGAALGAIGGAAMIYEGTKGQQEHSGWDVVAGVGGGAMAGASIGSVVPVIGTGVGAAAGAVIGGVITGSQLFSETDCLTDPVTGKLTCCHTQFNQGERYADIGDYMFCGVEKDGKTVAMPYGVRQCQQGGSATKSSWWDGLWKDDAWTPECMPRLCGNTTPPKTTDNIRWLADTGNWCWKWDCVDGYQVVNGECVAHAAVGVTVPNPTTPTTPTTPGQGTQQPTESQRYDILIQNIERARQNLIKTCGNMNRSEERV